MDVKSINIDYRFHFMPLLYSVLTSDMLISSAAFLAAPSTFCMRLCKGCCTLGGQLPVLAITCIVAFCCQPWTAHAVQMDGYVIDETTGTPLQRAWVTLQASEQKTQTNALGYYKLDVEDAYGVITAAQKGYFTQGKDWTGQSTVDFSLTAIPQDSAPLTPLPSATACQGCHAKQVDQWRTSRMAHAGQNRWVEDLYAGTGTDNGEAGFVYTRDSVHAHNNPQSECASCHQPERWMDDLFSAYEGHENASAASLAGVSCATCHLMADVDESKINFPGIFPGVVTMTRNTLVRYGALGDVSYHAAGRMRASLQPQLTSVVCATCHQDANDPTDEGRFDGPLSEPTYGEWKESPYGDSASPHFESCMGCHSTATNDTSASTLQETALRPPGQIRSHTFEGTTPEFLQKAVDLQLHVRQEDGQLIGHVQLSNTGAGHRVPTGVTIRNMILLVEAYDEHGPLAYLGDAHVGPLGGEGDPAQGYYATLPGKLYAKVNASADGQQAVLFTEAVRIDRDTRLKPFETDALEFPFAIAEGEDLSMRVRVIYRRAWRDLVDTKSWTTDGQGKPLPDLQAPHYGALMAEANWHSGDPETSPVNPEPELQDPDVEQEKEGCHTMEGATSPLYVLIILMMMSFRSLPAHRHIVRRCGARAWRRGIPR